MNESVESDALVIRAAAAARRRPAARLNHPLVVLEGPELVHLLVEQEFGVADILDPHPPHHLPRDDLDVLVVDVASLQPRKNLVAPANPTSPQIQP
jgi:hypothetical protein